MAFRRYLLCAFGAWLLCVAGEVTTVETMTKDYSRYVFNVGVAYREDTDQVVEVLRGIGEEMQKDDAYKDLILEPLEILGVDGLRPASGAALRAEQKGQG